MPSTTPSPTSSASTPPTAASSLPWREPVPRIVAEALGVLAGPPTTVAWPAPSPLPAVGAFLAERLVAAPAPPIATSWCRAGQDLTARRLRTALVRHGAALLADPVGSGKTFVALAVAKALQGDHPAAVIVPAPLVEQWRQRAAECGVTVEVLSHVALSRGHLPADGARCVVVDESHHFRHPKTQRYRHLAGWVDGRPLLCVTATPIVNRPEDLAHQLLLGARDDVLRPFGTPTLRGALRRGEVPTALGELVVATPTPEGLPGRREERHRWDHPSGTVPDWVGRLDALTLDHSGAIAALIRSVLWGAAASSPAALRATLGRYALLLRQTLDARRAGVTPDRDALRRFAAEVPEQLLFWELLPVEEAAVALPVEDLAEVERLRTLIDLGATDPKAEAVRAILADGRPSLVFTTSVATVPYLRERLASLAPAWVTGARAGWKGIHLPRARVLEWFRPGAAPVSPHVLVASDVAAEGLDLQRAVRVVHYDLPWTAMRLAQREGRSRRLGATHHEVEVVRMQPPPWIEERLKVGAVLRRKEGLLRRAGLAGEGAGWRWRHDRASEWGGIEPVPGFAVVRGDADRLLAAFVISDGATDRETTVHVVVDANGGWTEEGSAVGEILALAHGGEALVPSDFDRAAWTERCAPVAAMIARRAVERGWAAHHPGPAAQRLLDRAGALLRTAARDRDERALGVLEALVAFAARGHTAGEALRVEVLAGASDAELLTTRPDLRRTEAGPGIWRVRVAAAIAVVGGRPVGQ